MKETNIHLAIIGDLAYDRIITEGEVKTTVAGAAYNVAVGASTAAKPDTVGIVGRVGEDFTIGLIALQRRGVNTEGISIVPHGKTAVFTFIKSRDGKTNFRAAPGVSQEVQTAIFPRLYRNAPYIHLASSHPKKYLQWISSLRESLSQNTILSADANERYLIEQNFDLESSKEAIDATISAFQKVDLIFINEAELAAIKSYYPDYSPNKPMILKKGERGATYIDMKEGLEYSVAAPSTKVKDTTGAGDTLAGVFLVRRAQGEDILNSLSEGVDIASKVVTDFGVDHINPLD